MSTILCDVWLQSWICAEVLIRIVTLSFRCESVHKSVSSLCGFFWSFKTLHGGSVKEQLNIHRVTWTRAIMPCAALCFYVHVGFCVLTSVWSVSVCVSWVYFSTFVQDEWWGFPVYIPQLNMPVIAMRAECPAGSILKTLCLFHMEQLRPATRSLFHLTALIWLCFFILFFFSTALHCNCWYLLFWNLQQGCFAWHAYTCVCRWCRSIHWSRSLNSSFWSAQEPSRILVRYSWKMKYITSIPEDQIPDGAEWLEGDRAIFSSQQSPSSAE